MALFWGRLEYMNIWHSQLITIPSFAQRFALAQLEQAKLPSTDCESDAWKAMDDSLDAKGRVCSTLWAALQSEWLKMSAQCAPAKEDSFPLRNYPTISTALGSKYYIVRHTIGSSLIPAILATTIFPFWNAKQTATRKRNLECLFRYAQWHAQYNQDNYVKDANTVAVMARTFVNRTVIKALQDHSPTWTFWDGYNKTVYDKTTATQALSIDHAIDIEELEVFSHVIHRLNSKAAVKDMFAKTVTRMDKIVNSSVLSGYSIPVSSLNSDQRHQLFPVKDEEKEDEETMEIVTQNAFLQDPEVMLAYKRFKKVNNTSLYFLQDS